MQHTISDQKSYWQLSWVDLMSPLTLDHVIESQGE